MVGELVLRSLKPKKFEPMPKIRGYAPLSGVLPPHPIAHFGHKGLLQQRVAILDVFLKDLNSKGVAVALVISPIYYTFDNNDHTAAILRGFSEKYEHVKFFNYENHPVFTDSKLFQDEQHLNDKGAHVFSADLADKLLMP